MRYSATGARYYVSIWLTLVMIVSFLPVQGAPLVAETPASPVRKMTAAAVKSAVPALNQAGQLRERHANIPLRFEANRGQTDSQVKFIARGSNTIFLTANEAVFLVKSAPPENRDASQSKNRAEYFSPLRMRMVGANATPDVVGLEQLPGTTNYFRGSDAAKWVRDVPSYARVQYHDVYPGIDLVYYPSQRDLEYDFIVSPGASPDAIALDFDGEERVEVDAQGNLVIHARNGGGIVQRRPVVYQETDGKRVDVASQFVLRGEGKVGFGVGAYNTARPLVIDPVITYSTYLGGSIANSTSGPFPSGSGVGNERATDISVDADGNAYIVGHTDSIDFPTEDAYQSSLASISATDAFITKLDPTGSELIWSTYLGGAEPFFLIPIGGSDGAYGVALDSSRNVYVTGFTNSTSFPTKNPMQPNLSSSGGTYDAFVAKLNAAGNQLVFSTYLGGSGGEDIGRGIAVDGSNNVYVTGLTESFNFPTTAPLQQFKDGATFSNPTPCGSIAVSATAATSRKGDAVALGSQDPCSADAFLTKIDPTGQTRIYSTFLGGDKDDVGLDVAVDLGGNAYITGWTDSTDADPIATPTPTPSPTPTPTPDPSPTPTPTPDPSPTPTPTPEPTPTPVPLFPTTAAAFQPQPGANGFTREAFVTKVNDAGAVLLYSTFIGGNGEDEAFGIALGSDNSAYITGYTDSGAAEEEVPSNSAAAVPNALANVPFGSFPTTENAYQTENNGGYDAFLTRLNPDGTDLVYSTLIGGQFNEGSGGDGPGEVDQCFDCGPNYDGASVAVDFANRAYITGWTETFVQPTPDPSASPTPTPPEPVLFPVKDAAQPTPGSQAGDPPPPEPSSRDAFVAKFNTDAAGDESLVYSTFLGGNQRDEGQGIAVDLAANTYVTGFTGDFVEDDSCPFPECCQICPGAAAGVEVSAVAFGDNNFPTTAGSYQETPSGSEDGFVTKIAGGGGAQTGEVLITGRVTDVNGNGLAGVTITVTRNGDGGGSETTTTNSNGDYELSVEMGGNYTVTPSRTGYVFSPGSTTFENVTSNQRADFRGFANFLVSGRVTTGSPAAGLGGVTITITRDSDGEVLATTTTAADGNYSASVLQGGPYTVTPSRPFYTFSPPSRTIEVEGNTTGIDFTATQQLFAISGRIATSGGAPLSGVTVTLGGDAAATTTTDVNGDYTFGNLSPGGDYTVTPSRPNTTFTPPSQSVNDLSGNTTANFIATPGEITFTAAASNAGGSESTRDEDDGSFQITVTRTGDASAATEVDYATFDGPVTTATPSPSPVPPGASERSDYITSLGRLRFAAGETTKTIPIFIVDDAFVEGNETLSLVLSNPTNGVTLGSASAVTLTIVDNDPVVTSANPVDTTAFFVRQHYLDFLNREPDAAGFAFWTNNIDSCGADAGCRDFKRLETSKAFFLSIEFQETGFFVIRTYRAALDRMPEFREFLRDTQEVQRGVVVGQPGFQAQLESNRSAYLREFVQRPEFLARYPTSQTRDQYVDALFASADFTPTAAERQQVSDAYDSGGTDQTESRARALRAMADLSRFRTREFNPAFVLMEYIGYLRRNPDDPGFNFWLGVLNDNNDRNQMVRAFIISGEYRDRFGQ